MKVTLQRFSVKSSKSGKKAKPQGDKDERKIFSSELIASTYKRIGIISRKNHVSQFWPGTFSAKCKKLKLEKGASLGPELLIDFSI